MSGYNVISGDHAPIKAGPTACPSRTPRFSS